MPGDATRGGTTRTARGAVLTLAAGALAWSGAGREAHAAGLTLDVALDGEARAGTPAVVSVTLRNDGDRVVIPARVSVHGLVGAERLVLHAQRGGLRYEPAAARYVFDPKGAFATPELFADVVLWPGEKWTTHVQGRPDSAGPASSREGHGATLGVEARWLSFAPSEAGRRLFRRAASSSDPADAETPYLPASDAGVAELRRAAPEARGVIVSTDGLEPSTTERALQVRVRELAFSLDAAKARVKALDVRQSAYSKWLGAWVLSSGVRTVAVTPKATRELGARRVAVYEVVDRYLADGEVPVRIETDALARLGKVGDGVLDPADRAAMASGDVAHLALDQVARVLDDAATLHVAIDTADWHAGQPALVVRPDGLPADAAPHVQTPPHPAPHERPVAVGRASSARKAPRAAQTASPRGAP